MAEGSGGKNIAAWILCALLAALFFFAGAMKLMGSEQIAEQFGKLGFPVWFAYLVGLAEVGGAFLLLAPKVASYGAAFLMLVMIGAVFTTIRVGEGWYVPLIVLVLLGVVVYLRRPPAYA
jgi:putative oxidoreductase